MVVEVLQPEVISKSISGSRGYSSGHRNNVGGRGRGWGRVGPKFGTYEGEERGGGGLVEVGLSGVSDGD